MIVIVIVAMAVVLVVVTRSGALRVLLIPLLFLPAVVAHSRTL
jgi:hypothetical protein